MSCPSSESRLVLLDGQDKEIFSRISGKVNGEGGVPLYRTTLMALGPPVAEWGCQQPKRSPRPVMAQSPSPWIAELSGILWRPAYPRHQATSTGLCRPHGASKYSYSSGALLDSTAEDVLRDLVTDKHGDPHVIRVATLILSGIGRNLFFHHSRS